MDQHAQNAVRPTMYRWQAVLNVVVAGVFFGLFLLALNTATGWNPSGRRVPILLLMPLSVLGAVVLFTEVQKMRAVFRQHSEWHRDNQEPAVAVDPDADPVGRTDIYAVLWFGVFTGLVFLLGALLGTFAFSIIFLLSRGERLLLTLIYSVSVPIALHVIFGVLLNVRPFRGWLGIL